MGYDRIRPSLNLAITFVFGQLPITDALLSRYVPDAWRTKVLSVKFMLNLVSGAIALLTAQFILASRGGFETVMVVLAAAAVFIVIAALMLPASTGAEMAPDPAAAE